MKNKLFIIVACFSLMAVCSTAGAEDPLPTLSTGGATLISEMEMNKPLLTSDALTSRMTRINTFAPETLMRGQKVELCGNGVIDTDPATGSKEQCEFKDGVMIQSTDIRVGAFPSCNTENGETCNPDTCLCQITPICGDGRVAHSSGEQCESFDRDGNPATPDYMTMLCQRSRTAGADIAVSTAYACVDCMCELCGNGIKDPGEDCDGTAGCNSECKMAPEPEPKIQCSIKEYGALDADYIDELNAQGRAIMEAAAGKPVPVDLFGQEVHSRMLVQIEFPYGVIASDQFDPSLEANLAKSGNDYVTATGIYQLGGPVFNDLSKMVQRTREDIVTKLGGSSEGGVQKALLLFPRGSAAAVPKGKSLVVENEMIFVPDVSASFPGMDIQTDLGAALQDTNVTFVNAYQGSINGVLRFMVVANKSSLAPKAEGEALPKIGSQIVIFEASAWPAPGGWGDPTGELIHHDPNAVLAALQVYVNEQKAAGNTDFGCDIAMKLTGVQYEPQMFERFAAVSDSVKVNPATGKVEMAEQQVQHFGFYSVMTEGAFGGRAKSPCSLTGAAANVPEVLITLSMMVASLAGIGIIRRKKK